MTEKEYENIVIKNDKFTEDTILALGLVKKYIIEHKLIVVGGMAIDFALRLKGSRLYEDDVLPDYDFYSPNHHYDAYKIAELLHNSKLKNITVINANHISTMRVRVNYTVVADVTYIPKSIYDILPILKYRTLNIIHPHYQMIDQHRTLSLPYENTPWEVIIHRWKKDAKRYDILYNYYPLKEILFDKQENRVLEISDEIKLSSILFRHQCVGGFAALLYWGQLAQKMGYKPILKDNIGNIEVDSAGITVCIPKDSHGVSVYSNNIMKLYNLLKGHKKERMYNRFIDKLPFKIILDNQFELFDNKGCMLGSCKLENDLYVSNLQNVMLYMLTNYIIFNKMKNTNRGYSFYIGYILAYDIVKWASDTYKKNNKVVNFLPTTEVYGDKDISDSYLNAKRMFLERIKELDKRKLQPDIIFPETFVSGVIPDKYYKFKASRSFLFMFDGSETDKYIDRVYV